MDPLQTITEARIRQECGDRIFEKAFEYACSDSLRKRVVFPNTWQVRAELMGNYGNYVTIFQPLKNGLIYTFCSCPAEMEFCKHAAALGITWIREPETFLSMDAVREMVQKKSKSELEEMLMQALYRHLDCLALIGIEGFQDEGDYDKEDEWDEE